MNGISFVNFSRELIYLEKLIAWNNNANVLYFFDEDMTLGDLTYTNKKCRD